MRKDEFPPEPKPEPKRTDTMNATLIHIDRLIDEQRAEMAVQRELVNRHEAHVERLIEIIDELEELKRTALKESQPTPKPAKTKN